MISQVFVFFTENWGTIVSGLFALHGAALAIVNATETPKDDAFVGKFYKVLEVFAGLVSHKAKQLPGETQWESRK